MARRRRSVPRTLEAVVDDLPEMFLEGNPVAQDGEMVGLQQYMSSLATYLRQITGDKEPPVVEVMRSLGVPPSAWYKAALSEPPPPGLLDGPEPPVKLSLVPPIQNDPEVPQEAIQPQESASEDEPENWVYTPRQRREPIIIAKDNTTQ